MYDRFGNGIKKILRKEYPIKKLIPPGLKTSSGKHSLVIPPSKRAKQFALREPSVNLDETPPPPLNLQAIQRLLLTTAQRRAQDAEDIRLNKRQRKH